VKVVPDPKMVGAVVKAIHEVTHGPDCDESTCIEDSYTREDEARAAITAHLTELKKRRWVPPWMEPQTVDDAWASMDETEIVYCLVPEEGS
jgi:hypothetical protein